MKKRNIKKSGRNNILEGKELLNDGSEEHPHLNINHRPIQ